MLREPDERRPGVWNRPCRPSRRMSRKKRTNNNPGRPGAHRRHRVLGAQPRAPDHGRQPPHDPTGRVGLQRRATGMSSRTSLRRAPMGASPGRIPTNSGRSPTGVPGQTSESAENRQPPPLEDNTLCHFAGGQVVGSYATPAFQADSYQRDARRRLLRSLRLLVRGRPSAEPQIGAFQLHWNGSALGRRTVHRGRARGARA